MKYAALSGGHLQCTSHYLAARHCCINQGNMRHLCCMIIEMTSKAHMTMFAVQLIS